jgi:uncharacterized membrane protein HdeD (DUF308 family)
MRSENTEKQPDGQQLGLFIFDCVMSVLYLVFGIILLFVPFQSLIPSQIKIALGVVFIIYGVFRVFRAKKRLSSRKTD